MAEETQGEAQRPARSPEEVARAFLDHGGGVADLWEPSEVERRRRRRTRWIALIVAVIVALASGGIIFVSSALLQENHNKSTDYSATQAAANRIAVKAGCPARPRVRVNHLQFSAPANVIAPKTLYAATVVTTAGTFRIALNVAGTPLSLNSFVFLADQGYYNCNIFLRVTAGGLDLTGDPTGTGNGRPGYDIMVEKPQVANHGAVQYPLGSVVVANRNALLADDGEWFIVAGPKSETLPNNYSLLGSISKGMHVVEHINAEGSSSGQPVVVERILKVTIQTRKI